MAAPLLIPVALELAKLAAAPVSRWLFGEKAGDAAQRVVDTATMLVGGGAPEEVLARFQASEELRTKLQVSLATLDADLERAHLEDRADARKRDTAIQSGGRRNYRADIMLALAFGGVAFISWLLLSYRVDGATAIGGFLIATGGALVKMIGDAFAFEFGSSRSSKDKDAAIASALRNGAD